MRRPGRGSRFRLPRRPLRAGVRSPLRPTPQLPRDQGVLVTQVLTDSPAEKAGLHRNDILLQYNDKKIRDCDDLVRFLQADRPDRPVKLTLLHGGKETTAEATLTLGPAIRTAQEVKAGAGDAPPASPSRRAGHGQRRRHAARTRPTQVTIEFYPEGEVRLKTVTCEGVPDEIAGQVDKQNLPERERGMVQVALKRICVLNRRQGSPTKHFSFARPARGRPHSHVGPTDAAKPSA